MPSLKLRPKVRRFAEYMELKLRENEHKPGWKSDPAPGLLRRLREETVELEDILLRLKESPILRTFVTDEAADVANFAMMLADNEGKLMEGRAKLLRFGWDGYSRG